jgi:hypothetical protein
MGMGAVGAVIEYGPLFALKMMVDGRSGGAGENTLLAWNCLLASIGGFLF